MTTYSTCPKCHENIVTLPCSMSELESALPLVVECNLCGTTEQIDKGQPAAPAWTTDTGILAAAMDEYSVDVCPNCQKRTRAAVTALRESARGKTLPQT